MLAKIIIFGLLATVVVASPIGPDEEDEDIPVYTEKVVPNKPTRVPKFGAKKVSTALKKIPEKQPLVDSQPHQASLQSTTIPKTVVRTTKPVRSSPRPVRRINRAPVIPHIGYNEIKPSSNEDHEAPSPSFIASKGLGVEYALDEEDSSSHEDLVDSYEPRKVQREGSSVSRTPRHRQNASPREVQYRPSTAHHESNLDIGSAVGNAPQIRYAVAPQRFTSSAAIVREVPEYGYVGNSYDERPQPYIFGYELHDESGSTQSRREQGDDYGNKRGSYAYTDSLGIYRQVEYIADEHGFRAVVKTNEPGTANQNPADVQMHSEADTY